MINKIIPFPRYSLPPAYRIHVVGCARSGTTLMTELLRHAYPFSNTSLHEQSLFAPIGKAYFPYLSKKPSDALRVGRVLEADQDLYIVAVVRDPRAVVTSKHRLSSKPDDYFVDFSRWRAAMAAINALSPRHRVFKVHYEDLINDQANVQKRLEAQLRFLKRRRDFASFASNAQRVPAESVAALNGVRDFDTTRISSWKNHLPRLRAEVDAHPDMLQWLIDTGYETNTVWADKLSGVAPGGRTSKAPIKTGISAVEVRLRYWWKARRYLATRRKLANRLLA